MKIIADLHLHSKFARATSKLLDLENIYKWAKIKGITVVGTADFTHPGWFAQLQTKLEPAEQGLYILKKNIANDIDDKLPGNFKKNPVRFMLTVEISNIYSKYSKTRRMHNLIFSPSIESVGKFNKQLSKIGNLKSDGRPILGLDSKLLLKLAKDVDNQSVFIPAHIWTPWFSMFGSKSGFDSIKEAFEEYSSEIFAVETGLSSDPYMNWRLSVLDNLAIISNSDAHSPQKLGREANILNCELSYNDIVSSFKTNDSRFVGTVEYFPQEGMYHLDGHRKCNIRYTPEQTKKHSGICPVCHKDLVIGVLNRVDQLADRQSDYVPKKHKDVEFLIPLMEILSEIHNSKTSKKIMDDYQKLYTMFGTELTILREIDAQVLADHGYVKLSHALRKIRKRDVYIEPGYDGTYGIVKVFSPNEQDNLIGQLKLQV